MATTLRMPAVIRPHERRVLGAALAVACMVSLLTGVVLGHARVPTARAPRTASVLEASEEITLPPASAPEKLVEEETEAPAAAPVIARPSRRSGFGHMGADRAARRPWSRHR